MAGESTYQVIKISDRTCPNCGDYMPQIRGGRINGPEFTTIEIQCKNFQECSNRTIYEVTLPRVSSSENSGTTN